MVLRLWGRRIGRRRVCEGAHDGGMYMTLFLSLRRELLVLGHLSESSILKAVLACSLELDKGMSHESHEMYSPFDTPKALTDTRQLIGPLSIG